MIVVRLSGGLGNQMFQYAFGRHLAERHKTELKLDPSAFSDTRLNIPRRTYDLDIFNIREEFASRNEIFRLSERVGLDIADRVLNRIIGLKSSLIREPHFHFSQSAFNAPDNVYISGYWQSEKYFADVGDLLRREFTFRDPPSERAALILAKIQNTNSVCLNVRRGDFVINDFHGVSGVDYYQKADELLKQKIAEYEYFVFSDEIDWCEANLKFDVPVTFVSHECAGSKFQDYLRVMATCKHFVIPNSSFAWWAVWLNTEANRLVIAPKKWFNDPNWDPRDLIPNSWVRL